MNQLFIWQTTGLLEPDHTKRNYYLIAIQTTKVYHIHTPYPSVQIRYRSINNQLS